MLKTSSFACLGTAFASLLYLLQMDDEALHYFVNEVDVRKDGEGIFTGKLEAT